MRSMHGRFPHMPFYIAGKELSLEDVRLTLDKIPDRLFEHPATVFVLTNMYYAEAPWLTPASPAAAALRATLDFIADQETRTNLRRLRVTCRLRA